MAKGFIKSLVKGVVESGTALIIGQVVKTATDNLIPKKSGVSGMFQDICVTAARFAITYRATESMGDYVEAKYDKTAEACKNVLKAIDEIGEKGENDDDKSEPEIEFTNNTEASTD